MPVGRRSGRNKGPRTVYTEDPFVSAGISDESSSEKETPAPKGKERIRQNEDSASEDEFVAGSDHEIDDGDEGEDSANEEAEYDEEMGEANEDDNEDDFMEIDEISNSSKKKKVSASKLSANALQTARDASFIPKDKTHYRGILETRDQVSKLMHYILTYGSDDRDMGLAIHMRGRWRLGRDSTFPTRLSLEQTDGESDSPHGFRLGITAKDLEEERNTGWAWYCDKEIGGKFRGKQQLGKKMKEVEARQQYLPQPRPQTHKVLMGPSDSQHAFDLGYHDCIDLSQAWDDKPPKKSTQPAGTKMREGWLINIGQKIQCMAWAPNQDGLSQYLAVSAPITSEQKKKYQTNANEPSSAFSPSSPYPAAIQIWEFTAKAVGDQTHTIDMDHKPHFRLALCSEWGDLRQMAWCPMGREKQSATADESVDIGLLAGIWGDGRLRVLQIKLQPRSDALQIVKLDSSAFEALPPSGVCTSLAWLSPSDIAVGCSDGFVAVWSIIPSSVPEPRPYFYHPIHTSYILNMTSAYPTNPHLLSTISVDGETRLWSLLEPQGDNTTTFRVRLASSHLSYSPVLQAVCSSDENEYARIMPVRRFFVTLTPGKVNSTVSAMAPCSFWHPSLLYGGTGGEVVATNPMRRMLYGKEPLWQHTWFTHEWISGSDANSPGVSRFYDGFRAESPGVMKGGESRPMGLSLTTIYDEGTHVTSLAWNSNRQCAAWGSASLGCGLLRVEDLAI
ncbi:hypothetical protein N7478_003256 [Penicillium angulare]|uniref:uncharacterized protein n=1 Tax=Penicillium angulare TaxID=116970 RepID=UPI00253F9DC7|nr:uncharacterized protein N7478_003256 [Penicillium angulare]KAJ5287570.1 hypothetical protein N7478_003256 [Penicillium angulare]